MLKFYEELKETNDWRLELTEAQDTIEEIIPEAEAWLDW